MISYRIFQGKNLSNKCDLEQSQHIRFDVPPEEVRDSFILGSGSVHYQVFKNALSDETQKKLRTMNESGTLNSEGKVDPDIVLRIRRGRNDEAEISLLRPNRQAPPAAALEKFLRIGEDGKERDVADEDISKLNTAARGAYQKNIAPHRGKEIQELQNLVEDYQHRLPFDLEHASSKNDLLAKYAQKNGMSGPCILLENKNGSYSLQEKRQRVEIKPELANVHTAARNFLSLQKKVFIDSADDSPDALTLRDHAEKNKMPGTCVLFKNKKDIYFLQQDKMNDIKIEPETADVHAAANAYFSSKRAALIKPTHITSDALALRLHAEENGVSGECLLFKEQDDIYVLQPELRSIEIMPKNADVYAAAQAHFSSKRTPLSFNFPNIDDTLSEKTHIQNETPLRSSDLPQAAELLKTLPLVRTMELNYNETLQTEVGLRVRAVIPEVLETVRASTAANATAMVLPPEKQPGIVSLCGSLMKRVASYLSQDALPLKNHPNRGSASPTRPTTLPSTDRSNSR